MVIDYTKLKQIDFPVFALPSDDIYVEDGLVYVEQGIVDDRNQIGATLGARRLQSPHKVIPIRKCYEDITGLLRSNKKAFIDNKGFCFIYEKTKFCTVKFYKIIKILRKNIVTILKVADIPFPIIVRRPPPLGKEWVGILCIDDFPWIPYEYSEEYCKPFRRKI
jgi:hypothetical protein